MIWLSIWAIGIIAQLILLAINIHAARIARHHVARFDEARLDMLDALARVDAHPATRIGADLSPWGARPIDGWPSGNDR